MKPIDAHVMHNEIIRKEGARTLQERWFEVHRLFAYLALRNCQSFTFSNGGLGDLSDNADVAPRLLEGPGVDQVSWYRDYLGAGNSARVYAMFGPFEGCQKLTFQGMAQLYAHAAYYLAESLDGTETVLTTADIGYFIDSLPLIQADILIRKTPDYRYIYQPSKDPVDARRTAGKPPANLGECTCPIPMSKAIGPMVRTGDVGQSYKAQCASCGKEYFEVQQTIVKKSRVPLNYDGHQYMITFFCEDTGTVGVYEIPYEVYIQGEAAIECHVSALRSQDLSIEEKPSFRLGAVVRLAVDAETQVHWDIQEQFDEH